MVDDAVPMIRGRIDRIELHWNSAGIDDVVIRPTRDNNSEACSNCCPNAIDNRFTGTLLHAKELIGFVRFHSDLFLGLQSHDNKLTVTGRVKHPAKFFILDGDAFDVLYITFHSNSSFAVSYTHLRAHET